MIDYRLKENRLKYFSQLYNMNLVFRVHPGLVYLYMPELKKHFNWSDEVALYFATINGHTQNPITSLKIMEFIPALPESEAEWKSAQKHFDLQWAYMSFDTDRNKQKKDTINGLRSYAKLVKEAGSQTALWSSKKRYEELWASASSIHSFGRLSTFSYLEYIKLNGFGADCTDLMFDDFDGSRSHRNGMFFLQGADDFVFDKRQPNSHSGKYDDFNNICAQLETFADKFLRDFQDEYGYHPNISKFTLESCLCQFKNGFFSRRYPGVYADMAWDRIKWYDQRSMSHLTGVFKDIRKKELPEWLREECEKETVPRTVKAKRFAETGTPFRAEYILEEE